MFTGVKVFSATKAKERDDLGEQVTRWLRANAAKYHVDPARIGVTGGSAKTGTISTSGSYNPPHSVPVSTAAARDIPASDTVRSASAGPIA